MATWALLVVFALLAGSNAEKLFSKYDASDAKRVVDELLRLGGSPSSITQLEQSGDLPDPVVSSPAGDFEGYWTKSQFGRRIAAFEGIPYVKAPVGPLRFKVAEPLPHLGAFKAKKPGPMCIQRNVYVFSPVIEGQEDCLFINVYVPEDVKRSKDEKLPVMFWIHGGGFLSGSGDLYQPNILLDQDVLLVTINYRLALLGFLSTEDGVIPGNLGLKDQVAALRWVRDNIAAFGGNPNLVTIFGQSAGGTSAQLHQLSPLSRGLFHRAISISGTSIALWALAPPGETLRQRNKAAEHLGCPTEPTTDLLACLNAKTGEELVAVDKAFLEWIISPMMPFKPSVEGDIPGALLTAHPEELYAEGRINDVPWMFGMTEEEGGIGSVVMFVNSTYLNDLNEKFAEIMPMATLTRERQTDAQNALYTESLRRAYFPPGPIHKTDVGKYIALITDVFFLEPMLKEQQLHRKAAKSPTFAWLFSYGGPRSFTILFGDPSTDRYGACHADDLLYLFPLNMLHFGTPPPEDVFLSMVWSELYANFARDGVPSSKLLKTAWEPVTTKGADVEYLHVESPQKITMKKDIFPERRDYLEALYKSININPHQKEEL